MGGTTRGWKAIAGATLVAAVALALAGAGAGRAHAAAQLTGTIVYQYAPYPLQSVRGMNPDGSNDHQIGPSSNVWNLDEPAISPDGTQIAVVSNEDPSSGRELQGSGIYVMNSDGTGFHQVAWNASPSFHPAWSPDSTHIAFDSGGAIYTVGADGSGEQLVYNPGEGANTAHWPTWTADGLGIVFAQRYEVTSGDPSLVYDAVEAGAPWDGKPWRFWQVARSPSTGSCSPAESDINYRLPPEFVSQTCYLTPIYQLYDVSASGGGTPVLYTQPQEFINGETDPTHWTHVFSNIQAPRLSHRSGLITFLAGSPNASLANFDPLAWNVQVVGVSGLVTHIPGIRPNANSSVSFSPDDTRILYTCVSSCGAGALHIVGLDGSGDTAVPNTGPSYGENDWGVLTPPGPSRTPLIFVPGIEGTELYRGASQIWPNAQGAYDDLSGDHFLDALSLAPDGVTPLDGGAPLSIGDVVGHIDVDSHFGDALPWLPVHISLPGWGPFANKAIEPGCFGWPPACVPGLTLHSTQDEYNATLSHLESKGYELSKTLFSFPYDWRLSDSRNGALLADLVARVVEHTHAHSVDILAHSQGGLVTLAMLHDDPSIAPDIHRVVTLATPVLGAPKALGVMDYRDPCIVSAPLFGCVYDAATISSVTKTLPSAYELLPSQMLQQLDGSPLVVDGQAQQYDTWTTDVVAAEGSPALEAAAESLQRGLDAFTPTATVLVRLYGTGEGTVHQIDEQHVQLCAVWENACPPTAVISLVYGDGDGTVPTSSASSPGTPNVASVDVGKATHMALATDPGILDQALQFLGAQTNAPVRTFRPAISAGIDGEDVEASGAVSLLVTDALGRRTGADTRIPAQSAVEEIPGSSFEQVGDTGSAFIGDQSGYQTVATATGDGPVRILVRPYAASAITGQATFFVQDVKPGGTLRLDGAGDGTPLPDLRLEVDVDGDGTVDETLAPFVASANTATDGVPPTTVGGANLSGAGVSTVTLAADDGPGSGVAATWFELDGRTSPTPYMRPFEAPVGSTVRFRSIDNAGNIEDVRTLVVDDVSDERAFAQPVGSSPPLRRTIDRPSDADWFTFAANGNSTYDVAVESPAGATVAVYDAAGTKLGSAQPRSGVKKVTVSPPAGRCYVRVGGETGSATPIAYNVDVKTR